jgi:hypothetical protein
MLSFAVEMLVLSECRILFASSLEALVDVDEVHLMNARLCSVHKRAEQMEPVNEMGMQAKKRHQRRRPRNAPFL